MTVVHISPEMVEQIVEDFARHMMAKYVPSDDWRQFASNMGFRLMRLTNEKTSSSGSYRIKYEDPSKVPTMPAPADPEKKA